MPASPPRKWLVPALLIGGFILGILVVIFLPELMNWIFLGVTALVTTVTGYFEIKAARAEAAEEAAEAVEAVRALREAEEAAHADAQAAQDALARDERVTF